MEKLNGELIFVNGFWHATSEYPIKFHNLANLIFVTSYVKHSISSGLNRNSGYSEKFSDFYLVMTRMDSLKSDQTLP